MRFDAIQALRAVAALAVVVFHSGGAIAHWGNVKVPGLERFYFGVDLFFVISGFIMVAVTFADQSATISPMEFLRRRIMRIVPLYWTLTAIYVLFGQYPIERIVGSFLFLPLTPTTVVQVGWTLNYEAFFYVLFASCMWLERRAAIASIAGVLLLFTATGVPYYGKLFVLDFALGALIGLVVVEGVRLPLSACLLLVGSGVVALFTIESPEHLIRGGIPSAMIVAGATLIGPSRWPRFAAPALLVGNASYALYLTHLFMLHAVATLMRDVFGVSVGRFWPIYVVAAAIASTALAILIYRVVEEPLARYFKTRMRVQPAQ